MPTYEFECRTCGCVYEAVYRVKDCPERILCECGMPAVKVVSLAAVHGEEAAWINDGLRAHLQSEDEPPIETRSQLKRYEKEHNLVPRN